MESLILDKSWNKLKVSKRIQSSDYDPVFWSHYFHTYDVLLKVIPYRQLLQSLVDAACIRPGHIILDAGSGTGNLAYHLPQGVKTIFVDQSGEALALANKKNPEALTLKTSLTNPLPLEPDSVDHIICNNALYTLPYDQWPLVLDEFYRVLRPGGSLVLSNIREGFSVLRIYREHIRESVRLRGWTHTLAEVLRLFIPTLKMFWYNARIIRADAAGTFHFIHRGEQNSLMLGHGFWPVGPEQAVYAGQAWMAVGIKRYSKF
ncbi:MAG TPA: class I SAM-dependent methyltransferase [Saprospiraceae bacterium]|nr:class I SAM-dependent methyltransferase [Saprospiraceae bacterium]HNT18998.1 class I SAM-dependent methyltransferase [Saprospiraceae bacterium]